MGIEYLDNDPPCAKCVVLLGVIVDQFLERQ
jgi:hypothetical protein